ncbi:MAG: molecular chaperone HtpG [Clostridia bacterium]|nr:molecular chaperone HtpG [Clostridia bacterium]
MKREGQIKVDSENLFPIIKKWLYSDKDIFLREIVANGCDAIKKYQSLCTIGEAEDDGIKPRIDIILDKDAKTLTIKDNGIGMTEEEVEKYITQVAFSGAQEFIEKYKDKTDADAGIIGHFGLGFYSAYMVSDTVEIDTLSYQKDAVPVHWSSDGASTYEISDGERTEKGTTVIMHLSDEGNEFNDSFRLRSVLKKYCHFMPYEIYFICVQDKKEDEADDEENKTEEKPVNITNPLWLKAPKDCTTEEYEDFYREVFPDINLPLFWIHLNVDYPFNLKGILYFPKQTDKLQVMPGEIKLFSNQVYIADNIKEVVPEFLMLLKGVIDCPDMPLNVSRSFLQNDGEVAKISKHITKKVADKLVSVFKNERNEYESYWDDISPFIKFGCIKDEKFYDRMKDIILYKTINGEFKTFSELPKSKENKVYYVSDANLQAQYIKIFKDNGIDAVILEHNIDTHFVTFLEYKESDIKFVRIDSEVGEALASDSNSSENEAEPEKLIEIFKDALSSDKLEIKVQPLKSTDTPAIITINEYQRRINDMNKLYGDMFGANNDKAQETLIINSSNETVRKLPEYDHDKQSLLCRHIYDLAVISQRRLSADELQGFIARSVQVMELLDS